MKKTQYKTVQVELSWWKADETDVAGYRIAWESKSAKRQELLVRKDVNEADLVVDLKPQELYTFSVSVFDIAGNESTPILSKAVYVQ